MPEQRVLQDLVPRSDAGNRRVHQDEAGDALGMMRRQAEGDHVADVVGDHIGARYLERVHHPGDVFGLVLLVEALLGARRQAHAAEIGRDDGALARDLGASGAHMSPVSP